MRQPIRIFHLLTYLAFRTGEFIVRLFPLTFAFSIGKIGGELAYRILGGRRALALRNLRLAFGAELSEAELRALNREHFVMLGANLLAGLKASTLPQENIWERVTANVPENRDKNTGWIALISHLGNWELYSHLGQKFPEYRFGAVYQTLANPFMDRHMRSIRSKSGIALFDRRSQLLSCVKFLREGGVVGVLIDQGAGYAGLWTPLFGRLTSSSTLAATLSVRTGLPVVPIAITTCGRARWNLTISEPEYGNTDDTELLTARINRLLEQQIRRSPADWLWAHNRWKPLRPHFLFARDSRRVFFPPDFDQSSLDPFRILIVSPASSDQAAATVPAVDAIKQGRPDTCLTVLTRSEIADHWKDHLIDSVLEYNENDSVFSIASKIRNAARFDAAIFFGSDWKTSWAAWNAGVPIRVGRRSGSISWLYNQHPVEPIEPLDPVQMNLHIAQSIGAAVNQPLTEQSRVQRFSGPMRPRTPASLNA
jgi:lipopolysaccharide heptosyltransferase II